MSLRTSVRKLFTLPIVAYRRLISPLLPRSCIYSPTCSEYAISAIIRFGVALGVCASLLRMLRCVGGLYSGGPDPLPAEFSWGLLLRRYRAFWRWTKR